MTPTPETLIARLRRQADFLSDSAWANLLREAADTLEAQTQALQSIANSSCCPGCQKAARVARAALTPAPPTEPR